VPTGTTDRARASVERKADGRRQARILGRRRTFSSTTIGTALSARKFS
jgi:hypothetical protein